MENQTTAKASWKKLAVANQDFFASDINERLGK
jgi:hypothetical protein